MSHYRRSGRFAPWLVLRRWLRRFCRARKRTVIELVQEMPEDSSYDEILQELVFNRTVERGLADVEAGRTISDDGMKRTIESWRD